MVTHDNFNLLAEYGSTSETMLLLGSQTMNLPNLQGRPAAQELGCDDLDINGEAKVNHDLSKYKALPEFGAYSTIADFGTLEHVGDEGRTANALRNVFAWLVPGGVAIHVNPSPAYHDPEAHADCLRFTPEFWQAYAELTELEVVLIDSLPAYPEASTAIETRAVLQKKSGSKPPKKAKIVELIKEHCLYV